MDFIDPSSFSRPSHFMTKHIALDWTIDVEKKVINGSVILTFERKKQTADTLVDTYVMSSRLCCETASDSQQIFVERVLSLDFYIIIYTKPKGFSVYNYNHIKNAGRCGCSKNIQTIVSEALTSEFVENLQEMFPQYCMHNDHFDKFSISTTQ